MKKIKYLIILLFLIFLTSCDPLYDDLETVNVYLVDDKIEYKLDDTITVLVKGKINSSTYSNASILYALRKINESGEYDSTNCIDLKTSDSIDIDECKIVIGDIDGFYSFKVKEAGDYNFSIDIWAYKSPRGCSLFSKNLYFTVK